MVCSGFDRSLSNINNNICRNCGLKCRVYCDHRSVVVCIDSKSAAGTEYRLENKGNRYEVQKYNVDGAVIEGEQSMKCDNLVLVKGQDNKIAIFVELKGHKIADAYLQLWQTMNLLKDSLLYAGCEKFYARVVTSNGKNRGVTNTVDRTPSFTKMVKFLKNCNGSNYKSSDYSDGKGIMKEKCESLM